MIVPQSAFTAINVSTDVRTSYMEKQLDDLRAQLDNATIERSQAIMRAIKTAQARVEKLLAHNAKDTGLRNLPLHGFDQNRIWCALVMLALDLTAWTQLLALTGHKARRWEPKRLRLRLFAIPATLARHGRRILLHIKDSAPWADLVTTGHERLIELATPT